MRYFKAQNNRNSCRVKAQSLSIHTWQELQSVETIKGNKVFRLRMATGENQILKRGGSDAISEAIAAEIGMLSSLGINTVKTIPMLAGSPEVKGPLFSALSRAGSGHIIKILETEKVLLWMTCIQGNSLNNSADKYHQASSEQRNALYQALGRLWAFDLLIDNSDRFLKGANMDNIIVSDDLTPYGIDQKLGVGVRDQTEWSGERARHLLKQLVEPAGREQLCAELFTEINHDLSHFQLEDRGAFSSNFEAGLSKAIKAISCLTLADIQSCKGMISSLSHSEAEKINLYGFHPTLAEFRKAASLIRPAGESLPPTPIRFLKSSRLYFATFVSCLKQ